MSNVTKDGASLGIMDAEISNLKLASGDGVKVQMKGETIDRIFRNGVLVDEIHGHNLVVNSFITLVMALLKRQSGYSGATYWAVGSGAESWDSSAPSPLSTATQLSNEIGRVAVDQSEISFLDSSFNVVTTPTNTIQIVHTFGTSDCNGKWREFGIFGGNASVTPNSGIMINKRHHSIITKTSEMTIERTMRFTLNLA